MEPKLTSDLEKDVIVSYQRGGKKIQVFLILCVFVERKEISNS